MEETGRTQCCTVCFFQEAKCKLEALNAPRWTHGNSLAIPQEVKHGMTMGQWVCSQGAPGCRSSSRYPSACGHSSSAHSGHREGHTQKPIGGHMDK